MKAIIEIPKGSIYKYEFNSYDEQLVLDRVISLPYPENYGFIRDTVAPDGDPLDIFVVGSKPINPLTVVTVELLGVILMTDNGVRDDKIVAHIKGDKAFDMYNFNDTLKPFLENYKTDVKVLGFGDVAQAINIIDECYEKRSPNKVYFP